MSEMTTVERIARGICVASGQQPDQWRRYADVAEEASREMNVARWPMDDADTPRNRFRKDLLAAIIDAIQAGDLSDAEIAEDTGMPTELVARWRGQHHGGIH